MRKLLIIFLCLISISVTAKTRYVSTTGNNEAAGTISAPWLTWSYAIGQMVAGDTLYFRGGVYYDTGDNGGVRSFNSGTYADPICLFAYPEDYATKNYPILDCIQHDTTDIGYNRGLALWGEQYVHIKGLHVRNVIQPMANETTSGVAMGVIVLGATGVLTFENMDVYDIGGPGYNAEDYDTLYYINCDAHGVCDPKSTGVGAGTPGQNGVGFQVRNWYSDESDIRMVNSLTSYYGCRVWDFADNGFGMVTAGKLIIDHCWFFDSGQLWGEGCGIKLSNGDENAPTNELRIIQNCIGAYNGYFGIGRHSGSGDGIDGNTVIRNNTLYHNGWVDTGLGEETVGFGISVLNYLNPDPPLSMVSNNISYYNENAVENGGNENYWAPLDTIKMEYNNWENEIGGEYTPITPRINISDLDFLSLDSTQLWLDRKTDGSLPNITFLTLASTSDAIDAGTDVGLDYEGLAPDLGYAEYDSPEVPITPSVVLTTSVYAASNYGLIGGNVYDDGGGTISARGVAWAEYANPTIANSHTHDGTGTGSFIATISPLTSNTTYHVRAYSTNNVGTSYGEDKSFLTLSPSALRKVSSGSKKLSFGNKIVSVGSSVVETPEILVTGINVLGAGGATTITVNDGTLQMYADVSPNDAADTTITWSRINGTGTGAINTSGLLTAITDGTVTARATANDGSAVYGEEEITISNQSVATQIIADHTIVDRYDDIPANWIDSVKKMMVFFPGKSHSEAYRTGLTLLESSDPTYQVNVSVGESPTSSYLRANGLITDENSDHDNSEYVSENYAFTWKAWDTPPSPAKDVFKGWIGSYAAAGDTISVMGYAWCWTMMSTYESQVRDAVYNVKWMGQTYGGPDGMGIHGWGLDADDYTITGNRVSMDTYFAAMEDYITYCETNSPKTKMVFTTGPVDWQYIDEAGYQAHIKHEYIRDYVKADPTRILFDYADILVHDDDGSTPNTSSYGGNTYAIITTTNSGDENVGHIGAAGAIRLAKAQWWMLARIAGWDGN